MTTALSARRILAAGSIWLWLGAHVAVWALNGQNAVNLATYNGWLAFELVTQGNNVAGLSDAGYGNTVSRGTFDGLGTFVDGNKLSITVNHETTNAAISRVDVDMIAMRRAIQSKLDAGATPFPSQFVTGIGYAYDHIYDATYHAVNYPNPVATGIPAIVTYGNANYDRFCSGSSYVPEAFGPGRGLLDPMYITGEEVSGGKFYAIDPLSRSMWEVPALGLGSWENAAQVDTGDTTHVALVLNSDANAPSTDYLRLYIGTKGVDSNGDGSLDFLERNGLRGGTLYYFVPDAGSSATDLPDGVVTGNWSTSTTGALREDKLEDVGTNPLNGNQLAFNDQTDGVYRFDVPLQFIADAFEPTYSPATITQIDAHASAPLTSPDNLVWSRNGKIYVQQDGDGDEIWEINENGGGHVHIAHAFSEPSGIIDASAELGYQPGSVLLSSVQGVVSSGAQLVALISPSAQLLHPFGDYNEDGSVDTADYVVWRSGLDTSYTQADYDVWCAHFGQSAGGGSSSPFPRPHSPFDTAVPEPASPCLLSIGALLAQFRHSIRRRVSR